MSESYRSPKTAIRRSPIHGRGLFAIRPIAKGEIVAIKGGHVMSPATLRRARLRIADSYLQVEDDFYVGARRASEVRRNKLFINHSCEPNLGIRGQLTFVARRPIKVGEELTYDWAMEENSPAATRCACGARRCRRRLTGRDWTIPALQRRYRGSFAAYLEEKIAARKRRRRR
jgi:SET domain-containing protein